MNLRFNDSIGLRFLRVVFGCYLFVTVIITSLQLYAEYSATKKELITELANIGHSFENGLGKALWNLDNDAIHSINSGIKRIKLIAGVKVVGLRNDLQGATGVFVTPDSEYKQIGVTSSGHIEAKEIVLQGIHAGHYYEYTTNIMFREATDNPPELIGFISLYTAHDTVVQRFKYRFLLIIFIATLKTLALWLIFLYVSHKIVAGPLRQLTEASHALSTGDKHNIDQGDNTLLNVIANSPGKDEIQVLATAFLDMRRTIVEKLKNLYQLNDFAIRLSQASTVTRAFEHVTDLLKTSIGCQFAVIYEQNEVFWSSIPESELQELHIQELISKQKPFASHRFQHTVTYHHEGASVESSLGQESDRTTLSITMIPLAVQGFEHTRLCFFGILPRQKLSRDLTLTKETNSFLQVVAAMMTNTITAIHQRERIAEQNIQLEQKVGERTQELAAANAELIRIATHDSLTKLPNRALFNDRVEQLIRQAKREKRRFAIASIDLTKFKLVNDTHGHDAGDTVLVEVARRLSNAVRSSDTLARMGGDEFAAIFVGTNQIESIDRVVQNMLNQLAPPVVLQDGTHIMAGANIGIAIYPDHATDSEELFKCADTAMYWAKREFKGYSIFNLETNAQHRETAELMNELEVAIQREELTLHYQPIVDISTQEVHGFEALVRWTHPTKGIIPPQMFIPHAEKSQNINALTKWVLKQTCTQAKQLQNAGYHLPISVNISPRAFNSPDLAEDLQSTLQAHQLSPEWIKLEITESAAMANPDQAMEVLSKFQAMGTPISVDDFGTGHSSLAYLTRLPLDELKIDKSFIIYDSQSNRMIVETIIELAHALGLKVVAEGIETEATYNMLKNKDCDFAQGFYFGRPMPADKMLPYIAAKWHKTSA